MGGLILLSGCLQHLKKITVKSAEEILKNSGSSHECFKKIWENELPFKISFCGGCLKKRISIGKFWVRIGIVDEVIHCCCDQMVEETYHHLFLVYPVAN